MKTAKQELIGIDRESAEIRKIHGDLKKANHEFDVEIALFDMPTNVKRDLGYNITLMRARVEQQLNNN